MQLDPSKTAAVCIDFHRGHLDPEVATVPLPAERAARVIRDAAPFLRELRKRNVPVVQVVTQYRLCGVNTNTCVMCTAFESTNRDFRVIIAEEGVDTMDGEEMHRFALKSMAASLGWVMHTDEILKALDDGKSRHPAGGRGDPLAGEGQ